MIKWDRPCYKCLSSFCDLSCKQPENLNPPQRSFDYKEHAEGLQRDYDLLLTEYNELKAQRTWVGLTDEEIDQGLLRTNYSMQTAGAWRDGVEWAIKQFKEKNNG